MLWLTLRCRHATSRSFWPFLGESGQNSVANLSGTNIFIRPLLSFAAEDGTLLNVGTGYLLAQVRKGRTLRSLWWRWVPGRIWTACSSSELMSAAVAEVEARYTSTSWRLEAASTSRPSIRPSRVSVRLGCPAPAHTCVRCTVLSWYKFFQFYDYLFEYIKTQFPSPPSIQ